MGLSASQGRMLLLTARKSDLEYRAQQISQKRLILSQQLEEISVAYEDATSNRQMKIALFLAGAPNDGTDAVNITSNLTYAALISGTLDQFTPEESGIQAYSRTSDQTYSSTSAYRLVTADGAIVVSSADEIPTSYAVTQVSDDTPTNYAKDGTSYNNLYEVTKQKIDNNIDTSLYAVAPKGSPLSKLFEEGISEISADVSPENNVVRVMDKDNKPTYYDLGTGELMEAAPAEDAKYQSVKIVNDRVPHSSVETTQSFDIKEGRDNHYTVQDANGRIYGRYVVDETLKYGSSDAEGSTTGPNYLQDCLRNGKYLLEKGKYAPDVKKIVWSSLSWDAAANISDSYYTEDDDKAKAKYDRLQNQIQAQDKKLELELDNIETQRSAVTTEEESVKKVIDDNIKGSFNTFA